MTCITRERRVKCSYWARADYLFKMTAKSDDMAASEFNITRIKEIQSMFPKGEVSFSRLKQSRVRQYLERELVNCIMPLCPCVWVCCIPQHSFLY